MNSIQDPLSRLFKKQRIVFWYDADKELYADFEAVELPDVEKIELVNNEFAVKYRILREEPDGKFLLYQQGPQPGRTRRGDRRGGPVRHEDPDRRGDRCAGDRGERPRE